MGLQKRFTIWIFSGIFEKALFSIKCYFLKMDLTHYTKKFYFQLSVTFWSWTSHIKPNITFFDTFNSRLRMDSWLLKKNPETLEPNPSFPFGKLIILNIFYDFSAFQRTAVRAPLQVPVYKSKHRHFYRKHFVTIKSRLWRNLDTSSWTYTKFLLPVTLLKRDSDTGV